MEHGLTRDLANALRSQELFTLYQPVVALADHTMTSAEALARWPHPRLGMVPPRRFVAIAERDGLMGALSRFVVRDAVDHADWWNRHTPGDPLVVSVNVPAVHLAGRGQIDVLEQIVVGNDARTDQLMIELTGCGGGDQGADADAARTITSLRNRGFRVAVDDVSERFVGSDRHDTVDAVKLDRSLAQRIERDGEARRAVAGIVAQAHEVGVTVVAKGVDGARQLDVMTDLGCDQAQGFAIAGPGTARQLAEQRWQELERRMRPVPA